MPFVLIESSRARTQQEVADLMQAVYEAQREAFQVPEDDFQMRYREYPPGHFPPPPGRSANVLVVEMKIFPGRSVAAKRALVQGIVQRFGRLGVEANDVAVHLMEQPLENWGLFGGRLAIDAGVGFKLDV
jgi:phenylpyruvate tautomerase PptA (4-oxalocrotonate tautomerase family)